MSSRAQSSQHEATSVQHADSRQWRAGYRRRIGIAVVLVIRLTESAALLFFGMGVMAASFYMMAGVQEALPETQMILIYTVRASGLGLVIASAYYVALLLVLSIGTRSLRLRKLVGGSVGFVAGALMLFVGSLLAAALQSGGGW